jgi:uncharacterized protein (TIGR02246 family)
MRPTVSAVIAVGLLAMCGTIVYSESAEGVKAVDEAWMAAAKRGDVDAVVGLYAPDATYYPPDMKEIRGTAAIRKSYADWFAAMTITEITIDSKYQTAGDISFGYGLATLTMQPKAGGSAQTITVRVTAAARRINGKWLYIVDHASVPTGPPPAALSSK